LHDAGSAWDHLNEVIEKVCILFVRLGMEDFPDLLVSGESLDSFLHDISEFRSEIWRAIQVS
jgi:hypothetical protein